MSEETLQEQASNKKFKFDGKLGVNELKSKREIVFEYFMILVGAFIAALGLNLFLIPGELAAGGASGLATIIYHLGLRFDVIIPVGLQTIAMNVLLMIPVYKSGGLKYASKTIAGILALAVMIDVTAPFCPSLVGDDLFLAGIWGGVLNGIGLGLVFRVGANTGGTDILAQIFAKHSALSVGVWLAIIDIIIVAASAPIFSIRTALIAAIAMFVMTFIIDKVVDGPKTERAAFIISTNTQEIGQAILYDLGRGCTKLQAEGMWTNEERPVLFCVLSRKEIGMLKTIVSSLDSNAIVIISDVNEAFGEGFKKMGVQ